jgi:hypothetical protein
MQLTEDDFNEYLSQMVTSMHASYNAGNINESLKIAFFLLELIKKLNNKSSQKIEPITLFLSVSVLDFLNNSLKRKDFYSFNKLIEKIGEIEAEDVKILDNLFFSSYFLKTKEEADEERKRRLYKSNVHSTLQKKFQVQLNLVFF